MGSGGSGGKSTFSAIFFWKFSYRNLRKLK
jgi:hypothetical protein